MSLCSVTKGKRIEILLLWLEHERQNGKKIMKYTVLEILPAVMEAKENSGADSDDW